MSKPYQPQILTANALLEGDVIYLATDDRWVRCIDDAEIIEDEAHGQLRLLHALDQLDVVGPYLTDVARGDDGPVPLHFREVFRKSGPTNYPADQSGGSRDV